MYLSSNFARKYMSNKKIALIFGITGQDGSYLAEYLLSKKYIVHGVKRRSSLFNTKRIDHLISSDFSTSSFEEKLANRNSGFFLHYGDLTDSASIMRILEQVKPNEVYNLGAQSHVAISFEEPLHTSNANALGTLRILESLRILKLFKTKFYQASSSEMFGLAKKLPLDENSSFSPQSPYAISKLYSYWMTRNYRDGYGMFACNGILFNHESPRRSENFVSKKIVKGLVEVSLNKRKCIYLGNLYPTRDWGHAKDYVSIMHLILQQKKPDDYVVATGIERSVKDFVDCVAKNLKIKIKWIGNGLSEYAIDLKTKKTIVKIKKSLFRPLEIPRLKGNFNKAKKVLKFKLKYDFNKLVKEMIKYEIDLLS